MPGFDENTCTISGPKTTCPAEVHLTPLRQKVRNFSTGPIRPRKWLSPSSAWTFNTLTPMPRAPPVCARSENVPQWTKSDSSSAAVLNVIIYPRYGNKACHCSDKGVEIIISTHVSGRVGNELRKVRPTRCAYDVFRFLHALFDNIWIFDRRAPIDDASAGDKSAILWSAAADSERKDF